jgi:hypothetical protein
VKNEIKNIHELKGKTISDLKLDCSELWLKFTDNTFAVLVVNDITEGFGHTRNEVNINQYSKDKTDHTLVDLGLISENEYKEACKQEEIEYQKRQEERENQEKERVKNYELEQLGKLKSKYGL